MIENLNEEEPLVSISCISYNHVNYIRKAIEGFIMQKTNFRFEVLIHDDASTDGTVDIIKEYEAKFPDIILPLYEEENQWVKGKIGSAYFNYPRARGKYIALCEGDDFWIDPYKLQKQVDFLESHSDYGLVYTDIEYVDTNSNPIILDPGSKIAVRRVYDYIFGHYLNDPGFIYTTSTLFRRSLLDIAGASQWFVYDHWLFMDLARQSKVYFLSDKTSAYRKNPNGLVISDQTFIKTRCPFILMDQISRFYDKNYKTMPYYLNNQRVSRQIVSCYARLLYKLLKGDFNDWNGMWSILKKHLDFIFRIPVVTIYLFCKKIAIKK